MESSGHYEAAFMGRITASTTHEFRNVLAIVKESAGLIEDLVDSGSTAPDQAERLLKAVNRIDAQVSRGAELLAHLNRFAHCIDRTGEGVDLDQEIEQAVFLSQRLARPGRHRLEARPGSDHLMVRIDSLIFQMALFAAVEGCLEQVPESGSITVSTSRGEAGPQVGFSGEAADGSPLPSPATAAGWSEMLGIFEELHATVELLEPGYAFTITLPTTDSG
jgi:C4-dicarboxylate-specific signal transduction histidine kinase